MSLRAELAYHRCRLAMSLSKVTAETAAGIMLAGFFLALTGLVMRALQVLA